MCARKQFWLDTQNEIVIFNFIEEEMANSLEWTPMNLCVRFLHRVLDQTFGRIWDSFQISQIFSKFVVEILRKEYAFTVVHSNYNAHFELQFVTISLSLSLRCPRVPFHCLCGVFFQWACESMYFHVQIPCPLAFGCIEVHGSRTFVHDSFQTTQKQQQKTRHRSLTFLCVQSLRIC